LNVLRKYIYEGNMNPLIDIAGRKVGYDYDPLIIAEIGINHGGSLEVAFQLVDSAYQAGAEIVKHQTHIASDEMSSDAKNVILVLYQKQKK
jgi:sialic acid synthase SpsE